MHHVVLVHEAQDVRRLAVDADELRDAVVVASPQVGSLDVIHHQMHAFGPEQQVALGVEPVHARNADVAARQVGEAVAQPPLITHLLDVQVGELANVSGVFRVRGVLLDFEHDIPADALDGDGLAIIIVLSPEDHAARAVADLFEDGDMLQSGDEFVDGASFSTAAAALGP